MAGLLTTSAIVGPGKAASLLKHIYGQPN